MQLLHGYKYLVTEYLMLLWVIVYQYKGYIMSIPEKIN